MEVRIALFIFYRDIGRIFFPENIGSNVSYKKQPISSKSADLRCRLTVIITIWGIHIFQVDFNGISGYFVLKIPLILLYIIIKYFFNKEVDNIKVAHERYIIIMN